MSTETREIRLRQNMSRRLVATKINNSRQLLEDGHTIRYLLVYRPGEANGEERRLRLLGRICVALQDVAKVETPPTVEDNRTVTMVLKPL